MIKIKKIYDEPSADDGIRVLVDRIWPRGISKEKARIDLWPKDLAPSSALRDWFNHDPENFLEFECRYRNEIEEYNKDTLEEVINLAAEQTVTFLYSARNTRYKQAVVLCQFLNKKISG